MKLIIQICLSFIFTSSLIAQTQLEKLGVNFKDVPKSELLMLGTFHFNNSGLDGYVPEHEIDILSDKRQKELKEIITIIKNYAPTKIAIEVKEKNQHWVDSLYGEYLKGKFSLKKNEIYQIGFRLAKLLGHKKVYAVDAKARGFYDEMTEQESNEKQYAFIEKAKPEAIEREMMMDAKYTELYKKEDALKTHLSLLDYYLYSNDSKRMKTGAGHYLTGSFKMGEGEDYFGPDMKTSWFNRNLRIFHNLTKIQEPGKDKVFLLIGAGHLPILNFLAETSPDFNVNRFNNLITKK